MKLSEPLIPGRLIRRYQRFLADVRLPDGQVVTAHCPNSGSMMGLLREDAPVLLSRSDNPRRKLVYTWEFVDAGASWVCINTLVPNRLVHEAWLAGGIPELAHYQAIRAEVVWAPGCRFDFQLRNGRAECFVEVKNVTLVEEGVALFPDAKTERGRKHLLHLMEVAQQGKAAVMCFVVNREDGTRFEPARHIDPEYAATLEEAHCRGVTILVYRANVRPPEVTLAGPLKFEV